MGTANGDDMDDVSDDEEDEDYMPGEQEGNENEDAHEEDENGPHDHDYEDVGSIVSEPSEHADDDATNMGDVDMETEMEVSSGRSPDGYGAGTGATPDMVDAKKSCRILRLTALNSLLQCVKYSVWEVCSVN